MDDDQKAILHALVDGSDNPIGAILANIGGLSSSSQSRKRSRPDSDSSINIPSFPDFLKFMMSAALSSDTSDEGSSSSNKRAKGAEEEIPEGADEVVEKVKREKLSEHERAFLGSIVESQQVDTTFENVCLPEETLDIIRSMISLPLLCPEQFEHGILKQYTMSGALLYGPPGAGKTLLARALAKESGARMISIKPSDILHKCVGESERLVRALFELARRLKPCVIFIDEIDALFGTRTNAGQQSSARWHTSMLTEFMQEMDGLLSSQVVVLGATNRPFDLDDAVLRRLPCRVMIDLPEKEARQEILKILLREETLAADVKLDVLAEKTARYSGSDLKNLCLAAVFNAVKENADIPWKAGAKENIGKGKAPAIPRPGRFPEPTQIPDSARFEEITESDESSTKPDESNTKPDDSSSKMDESTPTPDESSAKSKGSSDNKSAPETSRIISDRHFTRALTEITPSSSDTQSSLNELRTWNAKFGSGANKATSGLGFGGGIGGYGGVPGASGYTPGSGLGSGIGGYTPGKYTGYGAGAGSGASGSGSGLGYSGAGIGSGIGSSTLGSLGIGSSGIGSSGIGTSGIGSPSIGSGIGSGVGASGGAGSGAGIGAGVSAGAGTGIGSASNGALGASGSNEPGTPRFGVGAGGAFGGMNGMNRMEGMGGMGGMGSMSGMGGMGAMNRMEGMGGMGGMSGMGGMGGLGGGMGNGFGGGFGSGMGGREGGMFGGRNMGGLPGMQGGGAFGGQEPVKPVEA